MSRNEMHNETEKKIKKFKEKAETDVLRIVEIGVCCILDTKKSFKVKNEFMILFKNNKAKSDEYIHILENYKSMYNKEYYTPIEYKSCILPQMIHNNLFFAEHNNTNTKIQKYDISSAYISSLMDTKLVMPCGNSYILYFDEAQIWFQNFLKGLENNSNEDSNIFAAIKAIVYMENGKKTVIPFFPLTAKAKSKSTGYSNISQKTQRNYLSDCQYCVNYISNKCRRKTPKYCFHKKKSQRQFVVQCLLPDILGKG